MKFADLTDQQKFEMFQAAKRGEIKSPSDIDSYLKSKEAPYGLQTVDKAIAGVSDFANSALAKAKENPVLAPWIRNKENLLHIGQVPGEVVGRGVNALLDAANIPQGPGLDRLLPQTTESTGFNPHVRDAAAMLAMEGLARGVNTGASALARSAVESKPTLSEVPPPPPPTAPPLPPFALPEVQDVADAIRRKDALSLQQRASKALLDTIGGLKEKGLSNAGTAAKIVNSYDLPISRESTESLLQAFPDHPEVQKLQAAMARTATGEARTKGNLVNPAADFITDKGENTTVKIDPTSDPVIGQPHPGAAVNYSEDPRFKTQFQEGMKQTSFPFDPLVGEGGFSTTEPLDRTAPILGRSGQGQLFTQESNIGKGDQLYHTPETDPGRGGIQNALPVESNPDLYKLLQLANNHAKYAPNGIEPMAMEARQARMGRVADELRSTIKGIDSPLPDNLSEEDMANLQRVGGSGPTGEQIQNVRNDTTKRMGLQEDLAPIARGDKELALINRGKGVNDTRAMMQDLSKNYDAPHLLNEADLHAQAEDHVKAQKDYFDDLYSTNSKNKAAQSKYQDNISKINKENADLLLKFGAKKFGILPSKQDLYNLSTRSLFSPMGAALGHLAVEKAGRAVGYGLQKGAQYLPPDGIEGLSSPWTRANLDVDTLNGRRDDSNGK